jgi:hypothetical protein
MLAREMQALERDLDERTAEPRARIAAAVAALTGHPADRPDAEREPRAELHGYIESGAEFLAGEDAPESFIVGELIPAGRTILAHGEPRTRKSWWAVELALAAATGTPAFGLARFTAPAAVPVLYSSQEDGRRDVRGRVRRFLAGRRLQAVPPGLFLSVHAGIDLESSEWQEALVRDISARGIRLVIFDPIRRFSPNVDKGPAEVRAVTSFLRDLAVKTGAAVLVIHHDVKPGREEDNRRRGHKASGGDWFASSDCPIHLEPAGRNRTLVVPEDFKHGSDPASFTFGIEEDEGKTWARLVAEDVSAENVGTVALHERILEFLRHNPGSTGNAVCRGARGAKAAILEALKTLAEAGRVDSVQDKRAVRWLVRSED